MGGVGEGAAIEAAIHCDLVGGGRVVFTNRAAGNLSTMRGQGREQGRGRREELCRALGLRRLCASRQVHGTVVQLVRTSEGGDEEVPAVDADGHATSVRELGMMVLVADCLPVALGSAEAVAMVHAGWRGLAAGVLEEGVGALRELGEGHGQIAAAIGPGASVCCYEVGAEVHAAFGGVHRQGRNLDLRSIARERLLGAGVSRVDDVAVCTICDERFFSHRREGARAGRQAGVAWLS